MALITTESINSGRKVSFMFLFTLSANSLSHHPFSGITLFLDDEPKNSSFGPIELKLLHHFDHIHAKALL